MGVERTMSPQQGRHTETCSNTAPPASVKRSTPLPEEGCVCVCVGVCVLQEDDALLDQTKMGHREI